MQRIPRVYPPHRHLPARILVPLLAFPVAAFAGSSRTVTTAIPPPGATIAVANCNDNGPGSLRDAIARAASGDTIDMSALACRRIELTSGAIEIPQQHLSLLGGPPGLMKVDAARRSSVFRHSGTGWLRIKRLNIANGFHTSTASHESPDGGCLYSAGKIALANSKVHGCRASSSSLLYPYGGGIFAWGKVWLVYSRVTGNAAVRGLGGGIVAFGGLIANHSHVSYNRARTRGAVWAPGGLTARYSTFSNNEGSTSVDANGVLVIVNSTVSGNSSIQEEEHWPTIAWGGYSSGGSASIINSTISGNTSSGSAIVGFYEEGPKSIVNSTIAFNRDVGACSGPDKGTVLVGSGVMLLDSTVISDNACNGNPQYSVAGLDYPEPAMLVGSDNLVTAPSRVQLPPDTISADPGLAPLADNGGAAKTHALPAGSPALDAGNNEAGLEYDQRGPGYPRVQGTRADIGAYER